ncbi:MAG TPA: tetratricopeptide repeat protein, partial [Acidimicrobiales bacterium]
MATPWIPRPGSQAPPPDAGRGYRRAAVVLFVLAAAGMALALIMLLGEAFAEAAGGDSGDVSCGAMPVAIVWGDGSDRAPEGYEDACRSSASEDVAIGGVLAGVSVAGAAGGVHCRRLARKARAQAPAGATIAAGLPASFRLGYGFGPARAELSSGALTLVLPSFLGRRRWTIPTSEITVVDPDGSDVAVPQQIVTASPLTIPDFYNMPLFPGRRLVLLFRTPQRLPPFRRFWAMGTDVSPRRTRSPSGVFVDGVEIACRRLSAVVPALVQAGARSAPSLATWAHGQRPLAWDPVEGRRIARTRSWILGAFVALVLLAIGARILVAVYDTSWWALAVFLGAAGLGIALAYLAPRLTRGRSEHPDTLPARANLAGFYHWVGRLPEAIALEEQVLAETRRTLGDDHPDTVAARANLAATYYSAGRLPEAIALEERVLADSERILGDEHPDTVAARASLAGTYHAAGRLPEAIALLERVVADTRRTVGDDVPDPLDEDYLDFLTARASLATAYHAAGRLPEAIALEEQVLADTERILGPGSPDTVAARANLASTYHSAGRLPEAITLLEHVLADSERTLGDEHPDTLRARANLAGAYHSAGRLPEAIALAERVSTDSDRILGDEHPDTVAARASLAG